MALSPASPEQQNCVQAVIAGNNVLIEASAGAGKSTTFYHTATAWLAKYPDNAVLLVCFNAVLRAEANRKVAELNLNVHCFTVHALAAAMYKTRVSDTLSLYNAVHGSVAPISPANYRLVLIDEAQDLNDDHTEVLNALQSVLPHRMQYMVVGDPRQEIYTHVRSQASSVVNNPEQYLCDNKKPWVRLILNTSYRLTSPVCELLNNCFRDYETQVEIKPGNTRSKSCLPQYIIGDRDRNHHFTVLKELLSKYAPGDIMILAPTVAMTKHRCQQLAYSLHKELNVPIFSTHKQRSDLTPSMMNGKVFLSTYHQSKGYERPCVLVLGVDEHEWYLNKCLKSASGKPLVHNSLHVALTRAQEQLVIFQHYKCGVYPTIRGNIDQYCNLITLKPPEPEAPFRRTNFGVMVDTRLVSFQPRSVLTRILQELDPQEESDAASSVSSSSMDAMSKLCKVTPETHEDVMDAYLDAIMACVERQYSKKSSYMELQVRQKVQESQVPFEFKRVLSKLHNNVLINAQEWIALSIIYNTMVVHDYPHELHQVSDLKWVGLEESLFIQQSVDELSRLLPADGFWRESAFRELHGHKIQAIVPFMHYSSVGPEPWQFTLNDGYTEHNLLLAMVHMFVFHAKQAHVYSISTNTKHTIKAPENLNTFLIDMLSVKLDG